MVVVAPAGMGKPGRGLRMHGAVCVATLLG